MVKSIKVKGEVAEEFVNYLQKVKETKTKRDAELDSLLKRLKPKIYGECLKNVKEAFNGFNGDMKLRDFLAINYDKNEPEPGTEIIVKPKPPRLPLPDEPIFSLNGTVLKF